MYGPSKTITCSSSSISLGISEITAPTVPTTPPKAIQAGTLITVRTPISAKLTGVVVAASPAAIKAVVPATPAPYPQAP